MPDTSEQPAPAGDGQLTSEQANAKGAELSAAADREKDIFTKRQLNTEAQRFFQIAASESPVQQEQELSQKMPAASATPDGPISREQGEALMREATGGALTYEQLNVMCLSAGPWTRQLEELAGRDSGAYLAAIEKGEADVMRTIYRGDANAMKAGLQDILSAINKAFGGRATAVVQMLDENAALANPRVHDQMLLWARSVAQWGH